LFTFKRVISTSSIALAAFAIGGQPAFAQDAESPPQGAAGTESVTTVGGAEMLPTRNVIENAVNSPIHTTLVAAIRQAELAETLSAPGPFTVFAPTDEAFAMIPAETVAALMQDAARPQLRQILSYHVLPGVHDAASLMSEIEAAGGELTLTTVEGSPLKASVVNGAVALSDEIGSIAYVTQTDIRQSNGVVHVINGVLVPNPDIPQPAEPADAATGGEDSASHDG